MSETTGRRVLVMDDTQCLGAAVCLCEPYGPQDLLAARDAVLNGETYYPPLADSLSCAT